MIEIIMILYVAISLFAIVMSYREQKRTGRRSPLFNLLSFLACVVWPATLAVVFVATRRRAH